MSVVRISFGSPALGLGHVHIKDIQFDRSLLYGTLLSVHTLPSISFTNTFSHLQNQKCSNTHQQPATSRDNISMYYVNNQIHYSIIYHTSIYIITENICV